MIIYLWYEVGGWACGLAWIRTYDNVYTYVGQLCGYFFGSILLILIFDTVAQRPAKGRSRIRCSSATVVIHSMLHPDSGRLDPT